MTFSTLIAQFSILAFAGLIVAAAWIDIKSFTIPNKISLAIALIYPAHVLASAGAVNWTGGLIVGAAMLVIGFFLFSFKVFGGGDAKLLAASALWAGPALISPLILFTALAGGAMAIAMWMRHRISRATTLGAFFHAGDDPDFAKRPMAYGLAVAVGALYVALNLLREV